MNIIRKLKFFVNRFWQQLKPGTRAKIVNWQLKYTPKKNWPDYDLRWWPNGNKWEYIVKGKIRSVYSQEKII